MTADLAVLIHGQVAGQIRKSDVRRGAIFRYEHAYLNTYDPTPLSLAFPTYEQEHQAGDWLDGLLPPSLEFRQAIGRANQAASQHPADLLATTIGMDCAGAVQFCPLADITIERRSGLVHLSDADLEAGLAALRRGADAWAAEMGRPLSFSLSGAQTKVALHRDAEGQWSLPFGDTPSTHILKINSLGWDHNDVIEHVCMQALGAAGLDVADTEIVEFGAQRAICVRRFDRVMSSDGTIRRRHQEDMCQAAAVPSHERQQWSGGPSPARIADILWAESDDGERCARKFRDALIANWVLLAGDAHAKNYSVLIDGSAVRLSPLYDVCSEAPWKSKQEQDFIQMAMKCAGSYDARRMGIEEWETCASALRLPVKETMERVEELIHDLPAAVRNSAETLPIHLRSLDQVESLAQVMSDRTADCERILAAFAGARERHTTWGTGISGRALKPPASPRCPHIGVRSGRRCILPAPHHGRPHRYSR